MAAPHHTTRPADPVRNDPHLRGGLSADYAEPGAASGPAGRSRLPSERGGGRRWVALFGAAVVGLLVLGMLSMTGLLNAGAPVDETVTSSVAADGAGEVSSTLPDDDLVTPSTLPEGTVPAAQ